ncbi:MAG: endonuclease III [Firmicutes bacterium]|jgi:endonuclease-3|uniref:Endonuclease III n=1 Tax=Sulfobacillus benefaciens TaxID=453960 RepID=A0A2T2X777_9FIRM|nr:endonuclease III [Bacillota bacterium]PSR30306.1 MAG: endonuclease III [Sulfobacillus benefaciens]HBQ94424.1 endonuclease III [Sulfobacillus sp.]
MTTPVEEILNIFSKLYPNPTTELSHDSPWQLLVATILSAQCTDKRVNMITPRIFSRFPGPRELAAAAPGEVEDLIKDCGLFRSKARNLIGTAQLVVSQYGGEVPATREGLMELPGVGRKTANVILANCFGVDAIAVDTHVFRLAHRLGWSNAKDVLRTEEDLMRVISRSKWGDAHHWLIYHGRRVCLAKNPRCGSCAVEGLCPKVGVPAGRKELMP